MKESCLFCKIASNEIESKVVAQTEDFIAFYDIAPEAPIHILCIPKKHFSSILEVQEADKDLMGRFLLFIKEVAKKEAGDSFRLVFNTGESAGQTVGHIHAHILAGRNLNWPPG